MYLNFDYIKIESQCFFSSKYVRLYYFFARLLKVKKTH